MPKIILVVDDSVSMRQLISFTLKDAGYEVLCAASGDDALSRIGEAKVDMVITDLNMPEMDGITLIQRLRSMQECRFVPIVMLTTEAQEARKQDGRDAGASGWIVKPFAPEKLLGVVRKFLK